MCRKQVMKNIRVLEKKSLYQEQLGMRLERIDLGFTVPNVK
jgi:hypothetical protein